MRVAMSGTCLALGQGVWISFLVTILVNQMSMSLTMAGLYFSLMQGAGVFGRIVLGWASDRLGSGRLTLRLAMITGWSPAPSQQQPARRGSATVNLNEVFRDD